MTANSLTDSFKDCAPWFTRPPEKPLADGVTIIFSEIHKQLFLTAWKLLYTDYGFKKELETGLVEITGQMGEGNDFYQMDIGFSDPALTTSHYMNLTERLMPFMNDFAGAIGTLEDVGIVPSEGRTMMRVLYETPAALWAPMRKIAELHPENTMAQAHLRTIPHLYERLAAGGPANTLC